MAAPGPTAGSRPLDHKKSPRVSVNESLIQTLSTKNFSLKRVIGQGSFSEVYGAIHTVCTKIEKASRTINIFFFVA